MRRVLITGMSGTGKSSVINALSERGYKALDTGRNPHWKLRRVATDEIDTSMPLDDVVAKILEIAGC